jgi:triacylglycerol lipase
MSDAQRIFLIPGMFGFGSLAGYDYFVHVRAALEQRFADAGAAAVVQVVPSPPTSSLRYRSGVLARHVAASADGAGPIHLVGHSTGGLDARLVLSPTTSLRIAPELLTWTRHARTCVSLNTPHYGTPLAGYFATVAGTRVLYALSLLTVISLSVGEPSLAVFSKLLSGLGGVDQMLGGNLKLLSRLTDALLRFVDDAGRGEVLEFLDKVRIDQGAIIQIMPEAMDLFNAAAEDNPAVRYASVLSASPQPGAVKWIASLRSPYAAFTAAMFSTLHRFTSQRPKPYPYATPNAAESALIETAIASPADDRTNDGIVPTLSMLWGELIWCGEGDHLDVIGHFHDDARPPVHVDWVSSGAHFDRRRFASLMDALARFLLAAA